MKSKVLVRPGVKVSGLEDVFASGVEVDEDVDALSCSVGEEPEAGVVVFIGAEVGAGEVAPIAVKMMPPKLPSSVFVRTAADIVMVPDEPPWLMYTGPPAEGAEYVVPPTTIPGEPGLTVEPLITYVGYAVGY